MSKRIWLAALGAVVGIAGAAIVIGERRFRSRVAAEVDTLFAAAGPGVGSAELRARWDALPDPVRRYLRLAIAGNTPAIRTARLTHGGEFRQSPDERWLPILGKQYFTVAPPGFIWNATVRPAPFLWIEARDYLLSGRGNMLVKLLSTIPIADASGDEIDQGASLRWLAEAAWFPYAFIGAEVEWEPIDGRSARATLRRQGLPVTAVFEFDDEGRIVQLCAERYRDLGGGKSMLTPWIGRYSDYHTFGGFMVPTFAEVAWDLDTGPFAYARFRVTALEYNVEGPF